MQARNRNIDLVVALGTLGRMIGHRAADTRCTKNLVTPPPILQIDADRSAVSASSTATENGHLRCVTLREFTTPELVTIFQGRPNLLPAALIVERTGTDTSRFGASGSARRGDALYTAEHATIRRAIVDALRPLRERYNVALRALDDDLLNTADRTVDVYVPGNLAGGFANGTFVAAGIDIQEAAAQHGLDRVRIHPYLIVPSTGNGADLRTSAASAIYSLRQVLAACLRPDIIRDEKLAGTRTPTSRVFEGPTIICPSNGRMTFANRETVAALAALDINLRGDSRFSADSFFTDWTSKVLGGHIGRDMICRGIGYSIIEFSPNRAAELLGRLLTKRIAEHLRTASKGASPVPVPTTALPQLTAVLESTERPTGTDVGAEAYAALTGARFDMIQSVVEDAHAQLQRRAADFDARLKAAVTQLVRDHQGRLHEAVHRAIAANGLDKTAEALADAQREQDKVAAQFLQRYAPSRAPDAATYSNLLSQLHELAQRASARWLSRRRETKLMRQIAVEAINADLAAFDVRVRNIAATLGTAALNEMAHRIANVRSATIAASAQAQELTIDAAKQAGEIAAGSVSLDLPGIILPTLADAEAIVRKLFDPRLADLTGRVIPSCTLGTGSEAVSAICDCVRAETAALKLDEVTLIGYLEGWPHAVDLDKFVRERINESWPTAPLDPTIEPGYTPPILRVLRSSGGSLNSGPLMERLRKFDAEQVNQVRDHDFGDPRRLIISHEQRFIAARQIAFLHLLEKEAQSVSLDLEPLLTSCVPDPRLLDEFRCAASRDETAAWATFVRSVARRLVTRKGDNTYIVSDLALHSTLHVTTDHGRLAQGLLAMINRLTNDTTLRKGLDDLLTTSLQRDGRSVVVADYLTALHAAANHVPANAVPQFINFVSREIFKLLPECRTADDAARLVGFTSAETPVLSPRPKAAADHSTGNGNGSNRGNVQGRLSGIARHSAE